MAMGLPVGHGRFRPHSGGGMASHKATGRATIFRVNTTTTPINTPIVLRPRSNPSSISSLLKQKHRMARLQAPRWPIRLPTAKDRHARARKGKSAPVPSSTRHTGRALNVSTLDPAHEATGPKPDRGTMGQPIVIPDDQVPDYSPEKAPISYVDHLLWPSERLVTPEINPFQHMPTTDQNTRFHDSSPMNGFWDRSPANRHPTSLYEPYSQASARLHHTGPRMQTEPPFSGLSSSPATSISEW